MYRILVTDKLSSQALERLEAAADASFDVVHRPPPEKLREIIPAYDAVIIRSSAQMDADALAVASRLKVVRRAPLGQTLGEERMFVNIPDAVTAYKSRSDDEGEGS